MTSTNAVILGATRTGKTVSAALAAAIQYHESGVWIDPHTDSLAPLLLTHLNGNLLYDNLSNLERMLGYAMLVPSRHPNPVIRAEENLRRAEAFVAILLRRREGDTLARAPQTEEWIVAVLLLYLNQDRSVLLPLSLIPFGLQPGSSEFDTLIANCTLPEIRHKFETLRAYPPRALRSEVAPATRLLNGVFRSAAFALRSTASFDLGRFLDSGGKLIIEKGREIGDDAMRVIMGAVILLVIDHASHRRTNWPPIRITIDESVNAKLIDATIIRSLAEHSKQGLYWTLIDQNMAFPGGMDVVFNNCHRHEFFRLPNYDLARRAAMDVLLGLPRDERSRAERLNELIEDIATLDVGCRWVRDAQGSRRESVPMPMNPWPDWGNLRQIKYEEKLCRIFERPEYQRIAVTASSTSSGGIPPPPSKLLDGPSPAERWKAKRTAKKPVDGS